MNYNDKMLVDMNMRATTEYNPDIDDLDASMHDSCQYAVKVKMSYVAQLKRL